MEVSRYTPRFGFWIVTTFVVIVSVFPFIFLGAFNAGGRVGEFWLVVGLTLIPGSCLGFVQALMLARPSIRARFQWFGITVMSTVIGWCVVFAFWNLLSRLHLSSSSSFSSDQLVLAVSDAFVTGCSIGAIIGLVTGVIQGSIQHFSARSWFVGNFVSWSIGVGVSFAVFIAFILQINLSF